MDSIYIKLEHLRIDQCRLYYQCPIDTTLHKATVFSKHYEYFYMHAYLSEIDEDAMKPLGSFRGFGTRSTGFPYFEVVHDIYLFDDDCIYADNRDRLYCRGIPELPSNLEPVEGMTYMEYPVFVSTK
jgi:hypothetical protein